MTRDEHRARFLQALAGRVFSPEQVAALLYETREISSAYRCCPSCGKIQREKAVAVAEAMVWAVQAPSQQPALEA